jgi:hypothetical protein
MGHHRINRALRLMTGSALLAMGASLLTALPASACIGNDCPPDKPEHGASSGDGMLTVHVSGSGVVGGSQQVSVPISEVSDPPTCWRQAWLTGAEYAAGWEAPDGLFLRWNNNPMVPNEDKFDPFDNYEDHADDTEGRWWTSRCNSRYHNEELGPFGEYVTDFFANHPAIFVPAADPPPPFYVPPLTLAYFAYDHMTLPDPQLGWNPQRTGDAATFVNFDTWVWLEDSPDTLEVTATAGANSATVVATLDRMTVSAPDARPAVCDGTGVPWSADAADGCVIVFGRSSANQPDHRTPVTIEAHWTAEWFIGAASQGELDSQTITETTPVPVAEVQAVVTG